jgi:hypothetical protein
MVEARDAPGIRPPTAFVPSVNLTIDWRNQAGRAGNQGSREDVMPEDFDTITRQCWAMAQRVGMQIAELPFKVRDVAFAGAEHCLRAAGSERGVAGQQLDRIVDLQMRAIRQIVTDIDVSGSPQGSIR